YDEERAFLTWLLEDHFTFLGCRGYELDTVDGEDVLRIVPGTGLGILRERGATVSASFATLPPEARKRARVKELLVLTKANARSPRSSSPIRATSCCRSEPRTSIATRERSCSSAIASACACWCARTRTRASCPASSSCRAIVTTPSCASASSAS